MSLSYDDASRISGINYSAPSAFSWTYEYDSLDRLTSATSSTVNEGWTYDADGNQLTETGTYPSTYSISATSNELTGITGTLIRTYAYDAAGNTLSDSTDTDTYNDAGRLKTVTNASGTTTFIYDALGRMIEASGSSGTTVYFYDQAGHLLGEYDGSGNLIQETVWLGDIPVATVKPNGSSVAVYYVETDHLDTPRMIIRPSDGALMWDRFSTPFGWSARPITGYDLRFPGQIAGAWGGTYQNYMRNYDPRTGGYLESDPIGLQGGSFSTYSYVGGNPLSNVDPDGLQVAAGAEIGTLADPGLGTVIGGVIGAGVEAGAAVYESCRDHNCPPCTPYGAGTIGYQGPHTTHEHFSKVLGRYLNPHLHLYIVRQNTETCNCFWNDAKPDSVEPPADPEWVDLNGGFPPLSP